MISIDDALESNTDLNKQEHIESQLSIEDQGLLLALDADIEDVAAVRPPGSMFEVGIARSVPPDVVGALKRLWESGGWLVGVFEVMDPLTGQPVREHEGDAEENVLRLVFARPAQHPNAATPAVAKALLIRQQAEEYVPPDETPDVGSDANVSAVARQVRTTTPLLIRMPTRGRPRQALDVLAKYRTMAAEHVAIEVVIDIDDSSCNNTQFLQAISDLDCAVTVGNHKNKIEACNGGRVDDWGILMLASDDMVPVVRGYDLRIIAAMEKHFPMLDGAINFNDGYNKDHVRDGEPVTNTLPIMGRWLYEDYGSKVYHEGYRSIYCDTDATFLFNKMNRMAFLDEVIVEHWHFANDKARFDEIYQHNSRHDDHDRLLFEERRARGFDVPTPVLSILICAVRERRPMLERLVSYLRWQGRFHYQRFEICVDTDEVATVGAKRQRLLERAVGQYVCFVDDDDWVSDSYLSKVLIACLEGKDCCSLVGVITEDGQNPRRFEHSLKHSGWYTREDGVYIRTPNHLSAIRREHALAAGFASQNVGEDHLYSDEVLPFLKTEADTGESAIYYYWSHPQQSVQRK